MYKNKKIIALIIAKKNSKGLKNKHLLNLSGKKIIEWSFSEANQSKYVDEVKGRVPIFGYPLMCYSPTDNQTQSLFKLKDI
jgi:hypothetical protein